MTIRAPIYTRIGSIKRPQGWVQGRLDLLTAVVETPIVNALIANPIGKKQPNGWINQARLDLLTAGAQSPIINLMWDNPSIRKRVGGWTGTPTQDLLNTIPYVPTVFISPDVRVARRIQGNQPPNLLLTTLASQALPNIGSWFASPLRVIGRAAQYTNYNFSLYNASGFKPFYASASNMVVQI